MKTFFALYMAPVSEMQKMMASTTEEERKKGMDEWGRWMKQNEKSLADMGAPLGKTKRALKSGISDVKNDVMGYSIVQAESHDAAAKLFGGNHPHFQTPGASVDIMEIVEMPGM